MGKRGRKTEISFTGPQIGSHKPQEDQKREPVNRIGTKPLKYLQGSVSDRPVAVKENGGWGRDELGVWDQQMQTIIYRMDKQQGPIVQHRELYSASHNKS